jgi:hypothetical protein
MTELLVIAALVALWVLASRYGYDSRDRPRSKEHEQALAGFRWPEPADPQGLGLLARERQLAPRQRPRVGASSPDRDRPSRRVRLAHYLRSLADRIECDGAARHAHA